MKKNLLSYFFCSNKISQNWILCYFWNAKEKNLGQFSKNCWSFYPKIFPYALSQIYGFGIRDPRSGKNPFRIPDPGVKKAPDPGSATLPIFQTCDLWHTDLDKLLTGELEPSVNFLLGVSQVLLVTFHRYDMLHVKNQTSLCRYEDMLSWTAFPQKRKSDNFESCLLPLTTSSYCI